MRILLFGIAMILWSACLPAQAQSSDSERLGMALEYFQGGKYHESLLILQKLDRKYRLNPRFRAYMGVCYYYEWDYANATACLDSVIPQLTAFSPQERSFYYFADAESHFNLHQYAQALPLYEQMLTLCRDNEKPDAYYRIAFIYVSREEWIPALDHFQSALVYYQRYRPDETARITQIRNMINGCCAKINNRD
ncbi:MAG: hypothetical protein I3J02_08295 [Prevotella sp.]|nr:hypothetical protein [Prevotella sp.]